MFKSIYAKLAVTLLLMSIWFYVFNIQPARASGAIYIRADGSVDPSTAPIQRNGNLYTLTGNITSDANGIIVERGNIVVDGAGYTLQGTGNGTGIDISSRNNVTIKNMSIESFYKGAYLGLTSHIVLLGNKITNNGDSGIIIENSEDSTLTGNTLSGNAYEFDPPRFAGIMLVDTTNSQITNNNMTGNYNGVYLSGSSNNTIFGNTMTRNWWKAAVLLEESSNNTISGNDIREGPSGIAVEGSSDNNIVSENKVSDNSFFGIRLSDSSNNTLSQNMMNENEYGFDVEGRILSSFINSIDTSNLVNGKPVHYLLNLNDLRIDPVTHLEIGFLAIINCTNMTIEGLNLASMWQGLLLAYTKDSRITNNNVTDNLWCGIRLIVSNNNTISRNSITNATEGAGVKLFYSSNDNTVSENNITNNRENGIELIESSDNLIFGNNVTNNDKYGIVQFYSYNNTILRNNIENEVGGIALASSSNNTISENDITNNDIGIELVGSSNNAVCHNNFINNTAQLDNMSPETVNSWDNDCEGNYWSDYNGTEFDVYGIGSEPYIIDANDADMFPLKSPYISGDVNHDAKVNIVDVTVIAKAFRSQLGDTKWDPHADMDENGKINIVDITKAAKEFGKEWVW